MSSVTQLGETMRSIMQTRAREIGQEHEAFKRERKLDGASFAQGCGVRMVTKWRCEFERVASGVQPSTWRM